MEKGWRKLRKTPPTSQKGYRNVELRHENNIVCVLDVKVPSTGGLQILGVGKAVGRERGGGGYGFQNDVADCAK